GFEFNLKSSLKMLFAQELTPVYDRASGEVTLSVAAFNPLVDVLLLEGATHLQFTLAAARLGDEEVLPRPVIERSDYIPLIGAHPGTSLEVTLEPDLEQVVYLVVGI